MLTYSDFCKEWLERLRNNSAISGSDTEYEFINYSLDILIDKGEVDIPVKTGMGDRKGRGGRNMRCDGYSIDETDKSIILFISDFQDSVNTDTFTMTRYDEMYWRLYYFIDETCNGRISDYFDESDDIIPFSRMLKARLSSEADENIQILKIRFVIFTNKEPDSKVLSTSLFEKSKNGKTVRSSKRVRKEDFNGKPLEVELWYPERYYDYEISLDDEPVIINIGNEFPDSGKYCIPCVRATIGDDLPYDAYISVVPGRLLADIYIKYGSKVLEGNVRAYLGTSGNKSVNSGIRKTINNEPTMFFTYNNGIATTAAAIEIEEQNGLTYITEITDLQIINGGQTTATLAEAMMKKNNRNSSLDGIYVQMKLTVIKNRELIEDDGTSFYAKTVQNIARYANSQNRVTAADLFSNDPFHVWMEKQSRVCLTPTSNSRPIQTGWYYERSRKKYRTEESKLKGDEQRKFRTKFPKNQVITKEELALYMTAIQCKPHIASKGKNWVMKEFGEEISRLYREQSERFNDIWFKKAIAAAILYRTIDHYLEDNKDSAKRHTGFWYKSGGPKLNIIPYTIAVIICAVPEGYCINWEDIWEKQGISPTFMHEVEVVARRVYDVICDNGGTIVTEYCKKASTWDRVKNEVAYTPSQQFFDEFISSNLEKQREKAAAIDHKDTLKLLDITDIVVRGAGYWRKVREEARKYNLLSYRQESALTEIERMAMTGNVPMTSSGKVPRKVMDQIIEIYKVLDEIESLGIKIEQDNDENL